ncbi:MAG: enoyl-CoA hydratase-related protein [Acidimicrobiia bacterium]|nr:enoyl-CoA hydratase-related protein [Acidimicrobiia bacterium]
MARPGTTDSGTDDMVYKAIRYDVVDGVATLLLSRPSRRNAWTGRMHTEYRHALQRAELDLTVRVVVVAGDPDGRAFCVGGDADALEGHARRGAYDPGTAPDLARPGYGIAPEFDADFAFQFGLRCPVIAAVNGAAAGVGLAVACFADLCFVADDARLTTAHGRLGLPAEYGLSWLLPHRVGLTRAADLLLTSRIFTGTEAAAWGLALEALPASDVLDRATAYASSLVTDVAPSSLAATRRQLYTDLHGDAASSVNEANRLLDQMMATDDYVEGVTALRERRPPDFGH